MKDIYKVVLYDIFQWLIVLSVPFIMCFFWPNHDERLMKFLCFQIYVNFLLCLSFLFTPKRIINNVWPVLFFIVSFINLFTHGMSQYVNIGISFIVPAITAIYVIANHLHSNMVPVLKKTIVITCLLNCALFLTQVMGLDIIFTVHKQTMSELWQGRPSAFMIYPANFALLCSVGLILAWEWRKWLCLPIGACLCLSGEYSVIAGLLAVVSVPFFVGMRKYMPRYFFLIPLLFIGLAIYHFWGAIEGKFDLRMKYLYPVLQNVWSRPLDGWGVGQYNRLPDSFFGFPRGNWSEMHCEPLDLLFCMGLMGIAVVSGWIHQTVKEWKLTACSKCLIVISVTSCFHSVFHFIDSLWLSIIVLTVFYVEQDGKDDKAKQYSRVRYSLDGAFEN